MRFTSDVLYTSVVSALLLSALAGCGDADKTAKQGEGNQPQGLFAPQADGKPSVGALPKGNPNTPLEQYVNLESGKQLMFMYYALSNMPLEYDKMAEAYSEDYRRTNDGFKKQDILKAIQPRMDQEIANAKANRYFSHEEDFDIGPYDFEKKAFPVSGFDNGSYRYFHDLNQYRYAYTNAEKLRMLSIPDDAIARKMEELRSKYQKMRMVIYAYAQDVDLNERKVKGQILKFKITDGRGTELYSASL